MGNILVIDVDLAELKTVGAQLSDHHGVVLAKSPEQALAMAKRIRPDLVLLEMNLGRMDGFRTMAELRKVPHFARIPFIFLCSTDDTEAEARALSRGAVDFIMKPTEKRLLQYRVDLHLRLTLYQTGLEHTIMDLEDIIVTSFSELVECRDENTGGHVQRTKQFTNILGETLIKRGLYRDQLSADSLNLLSRAAPLHDIGKIGISDLLLMKKGALTIEEYETVKLHTIIGADVLKAIFENTPKQTYLRYAIAIAEGHHERYDGLGYPHGLAGDGIELCNRIMSIVNVYDSLVTDRSYRPAYSHREACDIVMRGSGTEFDPVLVDVFGQVSPRFGETSAQFEHGDRPSPVAL